MKPTDKELIQHLTPPPGIVMPAYAAIQDKIYRYSLGGFVVMLWLTGLADLFPLPLFSHWTHFGAVLGMGIATWTFLVWLKSWRWLVRGLGTFGIVAWIGSSTWSWGFSLAAGAIIAAKEEHCFHFWPGRVIPYWSLVQGGLLIGNAPGLVTGVGWLMLAGLWTLLLRGRFQLPLFVID